MVKFKKALKSIMATAMARTFVGSAVPMTTASATTYDNCDIDRNGYVETADLILLNRYLRGQFSVSNYNQLDVNRNLTIDASDAVCLSAKLTGQTYSNRYYSRLSGITVPSPFVIGFIPDDACSDTTSISYTKYIYNGDNQGTTSTYTLTPIVGTLNSGTNASRIFGDDDRYQAYGSENTGIVCIDLHVKNRHKHDAFATGFIIDDHHIVTNAHCLYDYNNEYENIDWYNITINTHNADGTLSSTELTPVEGHIPSSFLSGNRCFNDYALITVAEDLSVIDENTGSKKYTYFSLANSYNIPVEYNSNFNAYSTIPTYITGNPQYLNSDYNNYYESRQLYSHEGNISNSTENVIYIQNIDASGGQSGSPVYNITRNITGNNISYTYSVLSILSGVMDEGFVETCRITKYQLQFYYNNPNINYVLNN